MILLICGGPPEYFPNKWMVCPIPYIMIKINGFLFIFKCKPQSFAIFPWTFFTYFGDWLTIGNQHKKRGKLIKMTHFILPNFSYDTFFFLCRCHLDQFRITLYGAVFSIDGFCNFINQSLVNRKMFQLISSSPFFYVISYAIFVSRCLPNPQENHT